MPNTREKLIEILETVVDPVMVAVCGEVNVSTARVAEHLIANGVTVQKWIPVTERLPEKEDANEEGTVLVRYIDERPQYQLIEWELLWLCSRGISHWMPLPEAPKGD